MQACTTPRPNGTSAAKSSRIVAFICGNSARVGIAPSSRRPRPQPPVLDWPAAVTEILLPCTGKCLPEHMLKAFEDGADLVCLVACEEGNCHHVQGCLRAARRVEFVRNILNQIGLGAQRLMMFHLPGSARQDMAMGADSTTPPAEAQADVKARIEAILAEVGQTLESLPPSPLGKSGQLAGAAQEDEAETLETGDDSDE
jgi:coenzyme F420-reducing hydrogenase delta subunit